MPPPQQSTELDDLADDYLPDHVAQAIDVLKDTTAGMARRVRFLEQRVKRLKEQAEVDRSTIGGLKEELESAVAGRHGSAAFDVTASVWDRASRPGSAIPFRSMSERRTRVISVLNLKGGVGKTTLAANLGATLWAQGAKVLLLDFDFQGSLSSACMRPATHDGLCQQRTTAESFFLQASLGSETPTAMFVSLARYLHYQAPPTLAEQKGQGAILVADDGLYDAETSAMLRWLWEPTAPDARFLLRSAVHTDEFERYGFDYVIADCPPRPTTACVSALACSDMLLIPVLLDTRSTERVPRLVRWVGHMAEQGIWPDLRLIRVVANRVSKPVTQAEEASWTNLRGACAGFLGSQANDAFLRCRISLDNACHREAASLHRPAVLNGNTPYSSVRTEFLALAQAIRQAVGGK